MVGGLPTKGSTGKRTVCYSPGAMLYRLLIRPLLYSLPAETAHRLVMRGMRWAGSVPMLLPLMRALRGSRDDVLSVEALGLRFATPIGLAAGLDKDAEAYETFGALGFAFVEVGTLTGQAQAGNPQPRLFRLVADRALVNRMGFNNRGADIAARHIAAAGTRRTILGINIGKTKAVAVEDAGEDYAHSTRALAPLADYLVVNVSSPNTPGLRDLQAVEQLRPLLTRVREVADEACGDRRVPLLVKIAPDLSDEDVDAVADLALELSLDGIIATNTTIGREGLLTPAADVEALGAGGLSGPPLKARALSVLTRLRARVGSRLVLVAAGGIGNADDAWERLEAGADLIQVYTALIYEGPGLPVRMAAGLRQKLAAAGLDDIGQLHQRRLRDA